MVDTSCREFLFKNKYYLTDLYNMVSTNLNLIPAGGKI